MKTKIDERCYMEKLYDFYNNNPDIFRDELKNLKLLPDGYK
ncbi:MAG: hypothetical protein Q7R95_00025 [bacterium]|nr:hypothetical protein [bacterium]